MDKSVELINISKSYGLFKAVNNISIKFKSNQITALLGPNGAGKTTTIKMLVGLLKPTTGSILFKDKNIFSDFESYKKSLSYVPDFPFLYERLTGEEFLSFVGSLYLNDLDLINKRIEISLKRFELLDKRHQLIKSYSHGMRQRLAFCASIMRPCELFIVDEPMVGLDPKTSRIFKDVLLELKENNVCVLLSTHQLAIAEELADQITILNHGEVLVTGEKTEILNKTSQYENLEQFFLDKTN